MIVSYAYTQQYLRTLSGWVKVHWEWPDDPKSLAEEHRERLSRKTITTVRLYAAAKKFGMSSLCDEIISDIYDAYQNEQIDFKAVNYVVDILETGDKLFKFVLRTVAFDMAAYGLRGYKHKDSDDFTAFMADVDQSKLLLEATIRQLGGSGPGLKPRPSDFNPRSPGETFTNDNDATIMRMKGDGESWAAILRAIGKNSKSQVMAHYKQLESIALGRSAGFSGLFD